MKDDLQMIKLTTGELLLGVVIKSKDSMESIDTILLTDVFKIIPNITEEGEFISAYPFMLGATSSVIRISRQHIITMVDVDEFTTKFYGSILIQRFIQKTIKDVVMNGKDDISEEDKNKIEEFAHIVASKFGVVEIPNRERETSKELH